MNDYFYNLYAVCMTAFVSALTGFGLFWLGILGGFYNVWVCIFTGMMFSALMYNSVKQMYPLRNNRKAKE